MKKKWYTLSPLSFNGEGGFWRRDSGLLCRTLQELGYESKVVMPFPERKGPTPDVLRATMEEMTSAAWWRALGLEGVMVAGWGRHRDTPIVRAIRESGTCCVLSIDGGGIHFPLFDRITTLQTIWRRERWTGEPLLTRYARTAWQVSRAAMVSLVRGSYLKYRHLAYADLVACQTPASAEGHRQLCALFGGRSHRVNIEHIGCPIPPIFCYDPSIPKERRVIAIGRWDAVREKRPRLLMKVIEELMQRDREVRVDIVGATTPELEAWQRTLEPSARDRVVLHGVQAGEKFLSVAMKAQVHLSLSSSESGPLVLFEMLRCGVTSVFLDSRNLPGPRWAAECGHVDLVPHDTVDAYIETMERAFQKWEEGVYCPRQISEEWTARTDAKPLVARMVELALAHQRGRSGTATAGVATAPQAP